MSIRRLPVNKLRCTTALSAVILLSVSCIPTEFGDRHADRVENFLPTPFEDPASVYLDPSRALGPPDGRTVAIGRGSFVTLRFFRKVQNGPGADLQVYEIGDDGAQALVAVSDRSDIWLEFPNRIEGPATQLDLDELNIDSISFVRIRGVDVEGDEPGFDLDAVEALQ